MKGLSAIISIGLLLAVWWRDCLGESRNADSLRQELFAKEKEMNWKLLEPGSGAGRLQFTILDHIASGNKRGTGEFSREGFEIREADLSPDTAKVAMLVHPWLERPDVTEGLYVAASDGTEVQLLSDGFYAGRGICWSSDGKRIAFVGLEKAKYSEQERWTLKPTFGLHVMDLEAMKVETLVEDGVNSIYSQAWSSDSKRILYINTKMDLMIYDLDARSSRALAKGDYPSSPSEGNWTKLAMCRFPSWSRDGKWILFNYYECGSSSEPVEDVYYLVRPDGSERKLLIRNRSRTKEVPLLRSAPRTDYNILWSPDCQYLLLSSVGVKWGLWPLFPSHGIITIYVAELQSKRVIKIGESTIIYSWEGK